MEVLYTYVSSPLRQNTSTTDSATEDVDEDDADEPVVEQSTVVEPESLAHDVTVVYTWYVTLPTVVVAHFAERTSDDADEDGGEEHPLANEVK